MWRKLFARPAQHRQARGFTLIELLTVVALIGILASVGNVSYEAARKFSRDVKRVNDLNALQTALELYYDSHLTYPYDGTAGESGLVLGLPETLTLSDAGFAPDPSGSLYMLRIQKNPEPNGLPYIYRSVMEDGASCDKIPCPAYVVLFGLEGSAAGLEPGVHALTHSGVTREASAPAGTLPSINGSVGTLLLGAGNNAIFFFTEGIDTVRENPVVQTSAVAVAPVATVGILGVLISTAPLAQLPQYFFFFFTEPFLFLVRRRRGTSGVVYHAFTKEPIGLAIVRLVDARTQRVIRSAVTDDRGRFRFIVRRGSYRIEVTKPGFVFPSALLAGAKEDAAYTDVYHGEVVRVEQDNASLAPSIPMDPFGEAVPDSIVLRRAVGQKLRHAVALLGLMLSLVAFVALPSVILGALVILHGVMYLVFRRLSIPKHAKTWGIVYDEETHEPVPRSVLRLFVLPYHKLVATTITDTHGRYNFLAGPAEVYLTVTRDGYEKTETDPVDLKQSGGTTVIATDLPLKKVVSQEVVS